MVGIDEFSSTHFFFDHFLFIAFFENQSINQSNINMGMPNNSDTS